MPPTPAEVDRNRLLAQLAERTAGLGAERNEQRRLVEAGEALLSVLRDLKDVKLGGVHDDDQEAARALPMYAQR